MAESRHKFEVINLLPIFAGGYMPTIFRLFGYLFQFYSNDHEPIHIHVLKGGARAKYSIAPVTLIENNGMRPAELKLIESIIEENQEIIAARWNEFFNNAK